MNKTICGIVVDEKFYKEFMERKFTVLDKTVKANVVEIYATSRDYAENAPEYTEAAQKVWEEIRAEIQTYYAAKDSRKEYKAMKHQNFRSIFEELKGIYADGRAVCKGIFAEWEEAQKAWKDVQADRQLDAKEKLLAKSDYIRAEEKYKKAYEEITKATQEKVADLKKALEEAAASHYRIRPEKVDNATLELLRLGVLKDSDIAQIAQDNAENLTMLAVIKKYAGEREKSAEMHALALKIGDVLDSEKEINAFDTLSRYGAKSYDANPFRGEGFELAFDQMFENVVANASDRSLGIMSVTDQGEGETGEVE